MTKRENWSRQLRQLNPAFAVAHGLSESSKNKTSVDPVSLSLAKRLQLAVQNARASGKLNVANIGLSSPLPDLLFDLHKETEVNLSMDSSTPSSWELHVEETLTLVDMSDNDICILDDRISRYVCLVIFRLKRCNLTTFPLKALSSLEHLAVLDLASNQITDFSIGPLPKSIRELDLSSNKLRTLVGSDMELPNLVKLNVSQNYLEELPSDLNFPRLQSFDCGNNRISELPKTFLEYSLQSLTTLEARHNRITVSPNLSKCTQLCILDLSENHLTKPPSVNMSLTRLLLSCNRLGSLDGLFNDKSICSQLAELHIRDNRLVDLDSTVMQRMLHVKVLDLRSNDLSGLPSVLGYLPHVDKLLLDGNSLRTLGDYHDTRALQLLLRKRGPPPPGNGFLPQETDEVAKSFHSTRTTAAEASSNATVPTNFISSVLVGSKTLNMEAGQMTEMTDAMIEQLRLSPVAKCIEHLKLGQNLLETINDDLVTILPNLLTLEADQIFLAKLPMGIGDLSLSILSLSRNRLTAEPIGSSLLRNIHAPIRKTLTRLDLSFNCLQWFPSGLLEFESLRILNLSNNKISSLAKDSSTASGWKPGLRSLEHLDLSGNCIHDLGDLPLSLAATCPVLKTLLLHNNELKSIPPQLGLVESLQTFDARGNPQRWIRAAILEKGCDAILLYLRNRLTPTELEDYETKRREICVGLSTTVATSKDIKPNTKKSEEFQASLSTTSSTESATSFLADNLRAEIDTLTMQLNNVHLSEAKKHAMKKTLAMQKAKLIREERRLRQGNTA